MRPAALIAFALLAATAGAVAAQPAPPSARPTRPRPPPADRPSATGAAPCPDPIAGRWQATVWRDEDERWDRVSVRVRRRGGVLFGAIGVTSWGGDLDQRTPPTCEDGRPAVDRWQQRLTGGFDGAHVVWRGSSPRQLSAACAPIDGKSSYNPDHFTGELTGDAGPLIMFNDDGSSDRGRLHHFRRTACQ